MAAKKTAAADAGKGASADAKQGTPDADDRMFGHYGLAGWIVAVLGVLALIIHLSVPYGVVTYEDEESETVKRSDIADGDPLSGASPTTTLVGTILMTIAGVALVATTYVPLPVTGARLIGWGGGALAAIGAFLALMSSMYWVGDGFGSFPFGSGDMGVPGMGGMGGFFVATLGGFTGILGLTIYGSEHTGFFWVIGPCIVAAAAIGVVLAGLHVCKRVVRQAHGVRDRARNHLLGGVWAMTLLVAVLLVPWTHGEFDTNNPDDTQDHFPLGAHAVLAMNDATGDADEPFWGGLALSIKVLIATAWVGLAMALVGSFGGILASVGAPAGLPRITHFAAIPVSVMLLWSFIHYILTWTHQWKPFEEAENYLPGFWPALLLAPYVLWILVQIKVYRALLQAPRPTGAPLGDFKPVQFD